MTLRKIFICFVVSIAVITVTRAQDLTRDQIFLATKDGKSFVRSKNNRFTCEDTIYLIFETANHRFSGQKMKTSWLNIASKTKHQTTKGFGVRRSNKRLWSWSGIEFTSGSGGGLEGIMGFIDHAAGMEAFIGEWTISARVDGLLNETFSMEVLC